MGRFKKKIITANGHDRRELGYYSTPNFVAEFIAREIKKIRPSASTALDPCVGEGELSTPLSKLGVAVDGYDIIDMHPKGLRNFKQQDFIEVYASLSEESLFSKKETLEYDYYILNPPYNCHEVDYIRANKKKLKQLFGKVGVGNMYSMFISAVVDLAKPGAVIGMIVFDSFLTAKSHKDLRRQILSKCRVHNLILCPQSLFRSQGADVRTCIMILEVGDQKNESVKVANRPATIEHLKNILKSSDFSDRKLDEILLSENADQDEFVIGCPDEIFRLFKEPRVSDLYPCITGISTGDDKKYLSAHSNAEFNIPFYKNPAKRRFFTDPDAFLPKNFLEISAEIPNFMVRNKKYLFNEGITCSSMGVQFGAAYLPEGSTYGVNANIFPPSTDLWWLLSFLNSSLCTFLVRGVLLRTNMITSGYVGRIPIPPLSLSAKEKLSAIAKEQTETRIQENVDRNIQVINKVIFDDLDLTKETCQQITAFAENVITST